MQKSIFIVSIFLLLFSCTDDDARIPTVGTPTPIPGNEWLIDQGLVFDGGPGKDGIPSVDDPKFTKASDVDFVLGNDLVLGLRVGDKVRAYPHPVLDWHEIVNDEISNLKFALTYCPLTGTGVGWNRELNGRETTFGVSGLLFESNLMPYDRETNSTWSQQRLQCVNGENIGDRPEIVSLVETTWNTWKAAYPDSEVLNTDTGFGRNYTQYPYGDFRTNNERLLFPITNIDDRLPAKERVLGVLVGEESVAYRLVSSDNSGQLTTAELIADVVAGQEVVIVRDEGRSLIVAFNVDNNNDYKLVEGQFPFILEGPSGELYDILGFSDTDNKQLQKPDQFMGYWFSWGTFYPNIIVSEE